MRYLGFINEDTDAQELCTIHPEGKQTYYIFYDNTGKYLDFKVEYNG